MTDQLTQLGVGAIFAILVLREVFAFLNKRKNGKSHNPYCEKWNEIDMGGLGKKVDDLHRMHSKTDEDGVPVWYVRRSLEKSLYDVAESSEKQTRCLEKIASKLDRLHEDLKKLDKAR